MSFTKELLQRVTDESDRTKVLDIFRGNLGARSYKLREASALEVGAIAAILLFRDKVSELWNAIASGINSL